MTKPKLSIVKNEVEVELTEANDPRLKGWRQAERFFCRADHQVIITDVEEYDSGGIVDGATSLVVHLATKLPGEEIDPVPWPLWFRREDDEGRSSLRWFDFAAAKNDGISDFAKHARERREDPDGHPIDGLGFETLVRLGLENRIAGLLEAEGVSADDLTSLSDWAYSLGYSTAVQDIKMKAEHLALAGLAATEGRRSGGRKRGEHQAKDAETWRIPALTAARKIRGEQPAIGQGKLADEIRNVVKGCPGTDAVKSVVKSWEKDLKLDRGAKNKGGGS